MGTQAETYMDLKENHETDKDKTLQVVGAFGFVIRLRDLEGEQGRWQNARCIQQKCLRRILKLVGKTM